VRAKRKPPLGFTPVARRRSEAVSSASLPMSSGWLASDAAEIDALPRAHGANEVGGVET
jgi:hypothetical protein